MNPEEERVIPPLRYGAVENYLYRGSYPRPLNHSFLTSLNLKTVISLTPESLVESAQTWANSNNIQLIHVRPELDSSTGAPITTKQARDILEIILNEESSPIYIHCLNGSDVTSLVIMALRKLQMWSQPAIYTEALRFTDIYNSSERFIQRFGAATEPPVQIPTKVVSWLWQGLVDENGRLPQLRNTTGLGPVSWASSQPLHPSQQYSTMQPQPSLTLIVATTLKMGIGKANALPWPALRKEMAYFAKTTKSPPKAAPEGTKNAVVMGRKTWESIPPKFRPLAGRVNVVLSHQNKPEIGGEDAHVASSLSSAIDHLSSAPVGHVFVIGGSSLYNMALQLPQTNRILWTRVLTPFDCDTYFPIDLEKASGEEGGEWSRAPAEELDDFVGREVQRGVQEESGVQYEFCLLKRR